MLLLFVSHGSTKPKSPTCSNRESALRVVVHRETSLAIPRLDPDHFLEPPAEPTHATLALASTYVLSWPWWRAGKVSDNPSDSSGNSMEEKNASRNAKADVAQAPPTLIMTSPNGLLGQTDHSSVKDNSTLRNSCSMYFYSFC